MRYPGRRMPNEPSSRLPRWKAGLFASVPTLLLLAAAEIALRIWAPPWTVLENHVPLIYEPHPRWGYRYTAGARDELRRYREIRQPVEIGPHGWRGRPPPPPAPGVLRVVCVGDSHTVGLEVGESETFPARLAADLARARGGPVVAVNLGLDGSGTDVEGRILREEGLAYAPDLVVLQVFRNDFRDTGRPLVYREVWEGSVISYQTPEQRDALRREASARRGSWWRTAARISYLARAARFVREGAVPSNFIAASTWYEERKTWEPLPERAAAVAGEIEAMARAARDAGAAFAVVSFPAPWALGPGADPDRASYPVAHVGRRLEGDGIAVLDLWRVVVEAAPDPAVFYHVTDSHPNARGYALMAEATARWLMERGLVPAPPRNAGSGAPNCARLRISPRATPQQVREKVMSEESPRRKVHIDLDGVIAAFEDSDYDKTHYLDLVEGEVLALMESDFEEEDLHPMAAEVESHPDRYLAVPRFDRDDMLEDLASYVQDVKEEAVREKLERALEQGLGGGGVEELFDGHPDLARGWTGYYRDCLRGRVLEWLGEQGVEPSGAGRTAG